MSKYTPEPWVVDNSDCPGAIYAGDKLIAVASDFATPDPAKRVTEEERDANAVLMAAAPRLLNALKDVYWELQGERGGTYSYEIEDLIKEAEGEA